MIAQIWRGRTRVDDSQEFTRLLQARIRAEIATAKACQGAYVLQRQIDGGQAESLVLTLYDHRSGFISPPDESLASPPLSDQEARLLVGCDPTTARYDVITDPRRALLYEELRRRFPLRIAAVR